MGKQALNMTHALHDYEKEREIVFVILFKWFSYALDFVVFAVMPKKEFARISLWKSDSLDIFSHLQFALFWIKNKKKKKKWNASNSIIIKHHWFDLKCNWFYFLNDFQYRAMHILDSPLNLHQIGMTLLNHSFIGLLLLIIMEAILKRYFNVCRLPITIQLKLNKLEFFPLLIMFPSFKCIAQEN